MKSARLHAFTQDPAQIRVEEIAVPDPGPGQVRVRMLFSPVNPSDLNFVHGTYHSALQRIIWNNAPGQSQAEVYYDPARRNKCPVPPYSLGGEGVGLVEACGSGFLAKRLLGKRVAIAGGPPSGCWQEYCIADAKKAVVMPADIPDQQAAMFFVNPLTAYVLIHKVLRVQKGQWVLLSAAGSALGKSVVRMAQREGFKTICVVRSASNSAELRALGADAVIETEQQDLLAEVFRITGGQGVRHALDCIGGTLAGDMLQCLGLDGQLVVYGTLSGTPMQIPGRDLMMPVARISGFLLTNWLAQQSPLTLLSILRTVKKLTQQGLFHTEVSEVFPLDQVVDAVVAATRSGRTGKVLLKMSAD